MDVVTFHEQFALKGVDDVFTRLDEAGLGNKYHQIFGRYACPISNNETIVRACLIMNRSNYEVGVTPKMIVDFVKITGIDSDAWESYSKYHDIISVIDLLLESDDYYFAPRGKHNYVISNNVTEIPMTRDLFLVLAEYGRWMYSIGKTPESIDTKPEFPLSYENEATVDDYGCKLLQKIVKLYGEYNLTRIKTAR